MEIRINGKVAALKTGSSFDYIIENRSFTGSDGYSMTISFPLCGCPQNTEILAMQAKFWDTATNNKTGKVEYSISSVRLYYFLQLNGFYALRERTRMPLAISASTAMS